MTSLCTVVRLLWLRDILAPLQWLLWIPSFHHVARDRRYASLKRSGFAQSSPTIILTRASSYIYIVPITKGTLAAILVPRVVCQWHT